jgi:hypothetical protein
MVSSNWIIHGALAAAIVVNFAKRLFTSEELVETFQFILGTYSSFAAVLRMYGSGHPVATHDPSSSLTLRVSRTRGVLALLVCVAL